MDAYEGVSVEDGGIVATTDEIRGDLKATFGLVVFLSGPDLLTHVSNKVNKSCLVLTSMYLRNRALYRFFKHDCVFDFINRSMILIFHEYVS